MAAEGIRIVVDDAAAQGAIARLQAATTDLGPAMSAIGAALVTSTQRRFERQAGPDGKGWKALSPRTANKRITSKRRRGTENILRVSGRLYSSIVSEASDTEVSVGTNVIYAAVQQLGADITMPERQQTVYQTFNEKTGDVTGFTRRSRANLARDFKVGAHTVSVPARPFLGVSEGDRKEILDIVADHLGAGSEAAP
ncbi:MAG: phage virion morphogenesis protein [Mesorhizobium amorphae]|nr:MAG: phage virion morphogenesis protein [Mesorhizobium amorphae]